MWIKITAEMRQEYGWQRVRAYYHACDLVIDRFCVTMQKGQPCCYIRYEDGLYYVGSTLDIYKRYNSEAKREAIIAVFPCNLDVQWLKYGPWQKQRRRAYLRTREEELRQVCRMMGMRLSNQRRCSTSEKSRLSWGDW